MSVAAGVAAVVSAVPGVSAYRALAVFLIALVAWGNLRGVRDSGRIFALPTYLFIAGRRRAAGRRSVPGDEQTLLHKRWSVQLRAALISGPRVTVLTTVAWPLGCDAELATRGSTRLNRGRTGGDPRDAGLNVAAALLATHPASVHGLRTSHRSRAILGKSGLGLNRRRGQTPPTKILRQTICVGRSPTDMLLLHSRRVGSTAGRGPGFSCYFAVKK